MRKVGNRLKELREEKGLSMVSLGAATGISSSAIDRWEKGVDPRGDHLIALAKFFGVTTDYLLGLKDD